VSLAAVDSSFRWKDGRCGSMVLLVGAGFQPDTAIVGQVCFAYRPRPIMRVRKNHIATDNWEFTNENYDVRLKVVFVINS
jgi:hypothetical protein